MGSGASAGSGSGAGADSTGASAMTNCTAATDWLRPSTKDAGSNSGKS